MQSTQQNTIMIQMKPPSIADTGKDNLSPHLDRKPLLAIAWPESVPADQLPFGLRISFWQLVRMKARPKEQAWVHWVCKADGALPERILDIEFPF